MTLNHIFFRICHRLYESHKIKKKSRQKKRGKDSKNAALVSKVRTFSYEKHFRKNDHILNSTANFTDKREVHQWGQP